MIMNNEDFEVLNTVDLDMILSDLPIDLLKENIKYQVENPLSVEIDYSTVVMDKCATIIEEYGQIEDIKMQIDNIMGDFYRYVLSQLDSKFSLDIDYETMSNYELAETGSILYRFFILRYRKNISKFIYKFIQRHKKMLAEGFADDDKRKDVVTLVVKKKTKSKDDIRILSNLPLVVKHILSLEHDPIEFIDLCSNSDSHDSEYIRTNLENFTIAGNFTSPYLMTILDSYNDVVDEIQMEVKIKLINKISA